MKKKKNYSEATFEGNRITTKKKRKDTNTEYQAAEASITPFLPPLASVAPTTSLLRLQVTCPILFLSKPQTNINNLKLESMDIRITNMQIVTKP